MGEAEQHQEEEDHHQLMGEDSHHYHPGILTMEVSQDPDHHHRVTHLVIRVPHHLRMDFPLEVSLFLHPDRWLQLLRQSRNEYSYGSLISRHIQNTKGLKTGLCGYFRLRTLCLPKE